MRAMVMVQHILILPSPQRWLRAHIYVTNEHSAAHPMIAWKKAGGETTSSLLFTCSNTSFTAILPSWLEDNGNIDHVDNLRIREWYCQKPGAYGQSR